MARLALRALPARLAERLLTAAISKHAWTFCGSGGLSARNEDGAMHFLIRDNPLADRQARPLHHCHWHSAVFADLFTSLLGRRYHCREVSCCAMGGDVCHFVVSLQPVQAHFKGLQL
jgi:divinyl protochlorophyllide a 8-vinyl-reductase